MIAKCLIAAAALALAGEAQAQQYWAVGVTEHAMSFVDGDSIGESELGERTFIVHQVYDAEHAGKMDLLGNQSEVVVNCKDGTLSQRRMVLVTTSGRTKAPFDPKIPTTAPKAGSMGAAWVRLACTGKAPAQIRKLGGPWQSLDDARMSYLTKAAR